MEWGFDSIDACAPAKSSSLFADAATRNLLAHSRNTDIPEPTRFSPCAVLENALRYSLKPNCFIEGGLRPGENGAIMLQNCHQCVAMYFAPAKIGAVAVPLNFMLKRDGQELLANNSTTKFSDDRARSY